MMYWVIGIVINSALLVRVVRCEGRESILLSNN